MTSDQLAAAGRLMDAALGYMVSAALRAATVTGLADHFDDQPRTPADLAAAGLRLARIAPTPTPLSIVEAVPAG